ncbi:MAG: selenium-dependent molybdenum cofactor biosynthesis protein YqeB [Candidatus Metalachnospira sp.]|nr:selenium-dependent molybdenum cofactor biosynthesis protein YqeB [Candidatus Metalachnospira sp.]
MFAVIKGSGDIASGIALRLKHAKFDIVMTDLKQPTAIRRTVCFSQAIINGIVTVEDVTAENAKDIEEIRAVLDKGNIAVIADESAECIMELKPDIVIDAILAKKNIGTKISDAPVVIAVGPGFEAGVDCHAVVETQRGHYLGRVFLKGRAAENTGVPGNIGGYTVERIIRAVKDGMFRPVCGIGDVVEAGQTVAYVDDEPVKCLIGGVLRGILPDNTMVYKGMKSGDVDPRCNIEHCYSVSDKALAVGGGVLEACLALIPSIVTSKEE